MYITWGSGLNAVWGLKKHLFRANRVGLEMRLSRSKDQVFVVVELDNTRRAKGGPEGTIV